MSILSTTLWIGAGSVALSVGFSAVAAGGLTWAAAGTGLQNVGWAAGQALNAGGSVIEAAGDGLIYATS